MKPPDAIPTAIAAAPSRRDAIYNDRGTYHRCNAIIGAVEEAGLIESDRVSDSLRRVRAAVQRKLLERPR